MMFSPKNLIFDPVLSAFRLPGGRSSECLPLKFFCKLSKNTPKDP